MSADIDGDVEDIIAKMGRLREVGIDFSLDDFGTGYSSLLHLQRLPLDQLKIDKSFVHALLMQPGDANVARSVVALGHSLGLTVIAEGVETEEQLQFLIRMGCERFQGWLFAPALPPQQLAEQWLQRQAPHAAQ